jgi:hypothetical protein
LVPFAAVAGRGSGRSVTFEFTGLRGSVRKVRWNVWLGIGIDVVKMLYSQFANL